MVRGANGEFERGHTAGQIAARLADHDQHFRNINGSVAETAKELGKLTLEIQRLREQAIARDATVITTAAALKDADDARRKKSAQNWSPIQQAITIGLALLALAGFYMAWIYKP